MPKILPVTNIITLGVPFLLCKSNKNLSLGVGWSQPEEAFVWTDGMIAKLRLQVRETSAQLRISVECFPYTGGSVSSQPALAYVNGLLFASEDVKSKTNLSGDVLPDEGCLDLTLLLPGAVIPRESGGERAETRRLGLKVSAITLIGQVT